MIGYVIEGMLCIVEYCYKILYTPKSYAKQASD